MAFPEHATSTFSKIAAVLLVVAIIFYGVALSSYNWSYQLVNTSSSTDPFYGRGVTSAFTDNGFGVYTVFPYIKSDDEGSVDPFCGPATAINLYDFSFGTLSALVWSGRSHDTNNWCFTKNVCIGLVSVCISLSVIALYLLIQAIRRDGAPLLPAIVSSIAGVLAMSALAVYASWMAKEQADIDSRAIPQEGKTRIGWGLGLVAGGLLINSLVGIAFLSQRWLNGSQRTVLPFASPTSGPGSSA